MNLSATFIQRPVMTTLIMIAILFFGIAAFNLLPISDLPDIAYPTIQVNASNPGSDALTMAATVATPLEQQIMITPGIQSVVSSSAQGSTTLSVTFGLNHSPTAAMTDIAAAINRAAGELPKQMPNPPTYRLYNPAAVPNLFLHVSSDTMTADDLYDYANNALAERISMVEGVAQVQIYGAKRAIRVKLNPHALAALNLSVNEVADQIYNASQNLPAGQVYDTYQNWYLEPMGQLASGDDYQRIIVRYEDDAPLRIEDIGKAYTSNQYDTFQLNFWSAAFGNKPSVVLAITKQDGANTVKMCDTITSMIPQFEQVLPAGLQIGVIHNFADMIRESVKDVEFTLILAFILVVAVIFLFLGNLWSTIIPSITLPLSILGTFTLMYLLGYSIDILSLLALTLVVGFLVDDAIVVLENNVRHLEMRKSPVQAALDGSLQISTTILSMTLSLAAVFIPLIFMPGIIGKMFHEFGMVVVISVLFSGCLSLSLTPMMCARVLREQKKKTVFERSAQWTMERLLTLYIPALLWVFRFRWVPLVLGILTMITGIVLMRMIPQDFLPSGDTGVIQGLIQGAQDVSPNLINQTALQASAIAAQHPAVSNIITATNIPNFPAPNQGVIYINLKPMKERAPVTQVLDEIKQNLQAEISDLQFFLTQMPEINLNIGTGMTRANYTYYLSTVDNPNQLYEATEAFMDKLRQIPEIVDLSSDMQIHTSQLTLDIDRDRASSYGIDLNTIEKALGYAYAEGQLNLYNTPLNVYQVIVQLEDQFKKDPDSLRKLWINQSGMPGSTDLVPLESLVNWRETSGPLTVNHLNQFISTTLFFNLASGAALSTAVTKLEQAAEETLPPNILRQFVGTALIFKGTMSAMILLLMIGIFTIYLILGVLYESFLQPLTILSALPGALFGATITLLIFGQTLSIYAYVGMIVLIGIVMKNGIMLVEFANENVQQGKQPYEAILDACKTRFRPILMTTIAAAMGAVPIALGVGSSADSASRRPLGLIILGGLLCAQFITYFFTPVVYLYLEELRQWRAKRNQSKLSI